MNRITESDLKAVLARINKRAGFENPRYSEVGSYKLDWAYDGVQLQQYCNEHGGIRNITSGYVPKRELYGLMHAYLNGMDAINQ